jgi:hypothetical protein
MIEYWVASCFGHWWLRVRASRGDLGSRKSTLIGWVGAASRGAPLTAGELRQAQNYASGVWWGLGILAAVLVLPVIGIAAAVRPGPAGRNIGATVIFVLGGIVVVALAQAGLINFRSGRTRDYLRHGPPDEQLPPGSAGLPRRSDFWLIAALALVVFATLLAVGLSSA